MPRHDSFVCLWRRHVYGGNCKTFPFRRVSKQVVTSFYVASADLSDIATCLIMRRKFFSVAGTLLIRFVCNTILRRNGAILATVHLTLYTQHSTKGYTVNSTLYYTLLHSTLDTPHLTLYTLHSTHYTLNSTLYAWHSTLRTRFTHFTLHFTHYTVRSILYTPHSTLYTPHSTLPLRTLHVTLNTLHFILHTLHSALYTLHSTLNTLLHTLHSTLYTLHCTLHTLHFTLSTVLHSPLYTAAAAAGRARSQALVASTRDSSSPEKQPQPGQKGKEQGASAGPETHSEKHGASGPNGDGQAKQRGHAQDHLDARWQGQQ